MRGTEFLDKMELVDPAYVEGADLKPKNRKRTWVKWGTAAACFALLISAGAGLLLPRTSEDSSGLPMLSVSEDTAAMGYEGYMAHDISELVNANPWNEDLSLSTLPVYQNTLSYNSDNIASGADFGQMQEFLLDVAERLGLNPNTLAITDDVPDEETKEKITEKLKMGGGTVPEGYFNPTKLTAQAEGLELTVDQTMTATVSFDPAVSLPTEYNFTHFSSYQEMAAAAEYLKAQYKDLIGMENPQVNISGGDYNIYNQQMYSIEFFDGNGNEAEQIVNYNFNRVAFYCDDEGKLFLARIYRPDLSQKVGDYPLITLEEAKALLAEGSCLTTVPYEMPGLEYVKKAELIYRTGTHEAYYMPYYRFYVELPEEKRDHNLKDYGAYYVPAVDTAYISNMPARDGSFH